MSDHGYLVTPWSWSRRLLIFLLGPTVSKQRQVAMQSSVAQGGSAPIRSKQLFSFAESLTYYPCSNPNGGTELMTKRRLFQVSRVFANLEGRGFTSVTHPSLEVE